MNHRPGTLRLKSITASSDVGRTTDEQYALYYRGRSTGLDRIAQERSVESTRARMLLINPRPSARRGRAYARLLRCGICRCEGN